MGAAASGKEDVFGNWKVASVGVSPVEPATSSVINSAIHDQGSPDLQRPWSIDCLMIGILRSPPLLLWGDPSYLLSESLARNDKLEVSTQYGSDRSLVYDKHVLWVCVNLYDYPSTESESFLQCVEQKYIKYLHAKSFAI